MKLYLDLYRLIIKNLDWKSLQNFSVCSKKMNELVQNYMINEKLCLEVIHLPISELIVNYLANYLVESGYYEIKSYLRGPSDKEELKCLKIMKFEDYPTENEPEEYMVDIEFGYTKHRLYLVNYYVGHCISLTMNHPINNTEIVEMLDHVTLSYKTIMTYVKTISNCYYSCSKSCNK